MKKLLFTSLIISGLAITSCQKARICECKVAGQTFSAELEKASKSDQETSCTAIENTYKIADPTASCELK
ncbi:MAG: hypothetical protein ACK4GL_00815 [Flavobacteriales bacterium]